MPASSSKYPFVETYVRHAPADRGVYILWKQNVVLYVGRTARDSTLRSRLADHFHGCVCRCSQDATHYGWEIVPSPELREAELLAEIKTTTGEWPFCNRHGDVSGDPRHARS